MLCPIYVFPSNHITYIYIITIIVYFIETYINIIKTSHMLLTYKSKCLTEVGKGNPGCFDSHARKILVIAYKSLRRF